MVLGVDVGGTKIAGGAVQTAAARNRIEHPTRLSSTAELLDGLEATVNEVISAAGTPAAIGVGVRSQIEYSTGTVETSVNIPLAGVPLRAELGRRFGVPVFVDNDANCAALAEAQLVPCDNLVMLTLGTGVGGGVIVGGRIFRGAHGLGAELGHFPVNADGPHCPGNCPNSGCLEAYCSGQALERDATELAEDKPGSRLARALDHDGRVSGRELVTAAEEGDPDALLIFDRFVLSAGHASMLLYSVLYLTGYGLTLDDLKHFRQLGSPTAGHPEYGHAAGIEATTGPLGQGLGMSVGLALAEAMLAARFNRSGHEIVDHHTYVIASDGDIQEGVGSEASSLAGHLGLGKLIVFYDNNHVQLAGETAMAFSEDVGERFQAYGWHVQDVGEDLSLDRLAGAAEAAQDVPDRPSLVIVRSHIGYGSPHKQDSYKAHGSPLGEEEVALTKEGYGWDPDARFLVPDEALAHFRECIDRGKELVADWDERLAAYRPAEPEAFEGLALLMERRLPDGWDREVPKFRPEDGMIATRKASQKVIQWAAAGVPQLVSGSADLEPSTLTFIEDGGAVERGDYAGRNVHYGVREHGMGAIVNGLNLHGLRAFGSTFFNFLDYMKPAVRLAALMRLPSMFIFTHDSIGLGEDGPTHQPIEQLAMLRAQPNINVVRPAGANETARACASRRSARWAGTAGPAPTAR